MEGPAAKLNTRIVKLLIRYYRVGMSYEINYTLFGTFLQANYGGKRKKTASDVYLRLLLKKKIV